MTGIQTQDATAPYTPLSAGGEDVAAGAEVEIVPANAGRSKIIVVHTGTTGTVWLGLGQTAQVGVGLPLGPGGSLNEPLACVIRAHNPGSATIHVAWVELGV